ncbi:MAG: 4-(cytidine 5'-diphospho)-2-C-methyl-D-erythritol kinase [Planctomycetaceae bacterium]|nr:4-(cytidine 5'-diphospho)-2-C-methyl-D-erythritol kinase [Planctomycetaceae bacterium]
MIVRPTAEGVEVLAPAKLNLFLEILGRRPDGYHEIESLMVAVDLYDRLTFVDDPSGRIALRCDDPTLSTGPDNLVVKAAERLQAASGCPRGATIALYKAIPAQAGLAGGSSDAAATLEALDRLWDLRTPPGRMDALAGEIGSDVVFFRYAPAAVCRGRGERVEAVTLSRALHFVLICPPVGLSTAEVYRHLRPPERPRPIGPVLAALVDGRPAPLGGSLFNRLQPVAEALRPALAPVRDALASLGPALAGHLMSGSGSAYFGLGRDRDAADAAARHFRTLGLGRVRVVTCGP